MEAVQPISGFQVQRHSLNTVQRVQEVTVEDVWTRFFFEKNLLCYQVLPRIDSGEIVLHQELKDYSEYKNTLKVLQAARACDAVIKIPKKSTIPVLPLKNGMVFGKCNSVLQL